MPSRNGKTESPASVPPPLHELEAEVMVRRREGKTDFFAASLSRDEYLALRARAEVEDLVAQYGDVALSHFAQQMATLDPARRRALQRLARKT